MSKCVYGNSSHLGRWARGCSAAVSPVRIAEAKAELLLKRFLAIEMEEIRQDKQKRSSSQTRRDFLCRGSDFRIGRVKLHYFMVT